MPRSPLSSISVLFRVAFVLGLFASTACAIKPFQDQFYLLYLNQQSADSGVAAYATRVREAKCNLCHLGNSKKNRNTYGGELAKLLDVGEDKGNVEKIRNAFLRVAELKSDPSDGNARSFGQLIAARELPGAEPKTAIAPMDSR